MKITGRFVPGLLAAAALSLTASVPASAYSGDALVGKAKVGLIQARRIALKAHPGVIVAEELERERGGSGLRYSFDTKRGWVTQEVDAATGRVLENKAEGPNRD